MIFFGKPMRLAIVAGLYLLASPIYAILGVIKLRKLLRVRRTMASGRVICPHCNKPNVLDIKATCTKCKVTEYGNRLRCSACGHIAKGFECDECETQIWIF